MRSGFMVLPESRLQRRAAVTHHMLLESPALDPLTPVFQRREAELRTIFPTGGWKSQQRSRYNKGFIADIEQRKMKWVLILARRPDSWPAPWIGGPGRSPAYRMQHFTAHSYAGSKHFWIKILREGGFLMIRHAMPVVTLWYVRLHGLSHGITS